MRSLDSDEMKIVVRTPLSPWLTPHGENKDRPQESNMSRLSNEINETQSDQSVWPDHL
jgi:hypothetical protein